MEALRNEILGWLGYLDRWSVSWQISYVICVAIAILLTRRFTQLFNNKQTLAILLGPLTLLGTGLLLWFANIPSLIALQVGLFWALISIVNWIESKLKINNPKNQLISWLSKIVRPAILIWAFTHFIERLSSLSAISIISLGSFSNTNFAIGNIFTIAVGLYLVLATSQLLATITSYLTQFILRFDERTRKLIQPLFRYLIIATGLITLALLAGFDRSTFLVIFGALGFGLGFGIQEPIADFVTGIWLALEGKVKPGEILMIDNEPCRVKQVGLRATFLRRHRDDAELLIPNKTLFQTQAESFTAGENDRRETIVVGAAYHHDPQRIIDLLEDIAQSHKRVLSQPCPQAFTVDFADSSITYKLRFSVRNPLEALNVGSELRQQIWTAFEENDITIPFPQRQVYPMEWPPKDKTTLR